MGVEEGVAFAKELRLQLKDSYSSKTAFHGVVGGHLCACTQEAFVVTSRVEGHR